MKRNSRRRKEGTEAGAGPGSVNSTPLPSYALPKRCPGLIHVIPNPLPLPDALCCAMPGPDTRYPATRRRRWRARKGGGSRGRILWGEGA
eukprot:2358397-Rhodomonas_salina.1